jgi:hypothetical protein
MHGEVQQLRIGIDEAKRQQQVQQVIETDFFSRTSGQGS